LDNGASKNIIGAKYLPACDKNSIETNEQALINLRGRLYECVPRLFFATIGKGPWNLFYLRELLRGDY